MKKQIDHVKHIFLMVLSVLHFQTVFSQELMPSVIGSAGESREIGSYNYSWTVGETAILTLGSESGTVLQGFHQTRYFFDVKSEELLLEMDIKMYPNPAFGQISFDFPETVSNLKLECLDPSGQLIFEQVLYQHNSQVSLNGLPSGLFIIEIKDRKNRKVFMGKLVKI